FYKDSAIVFAATPRAVVRAIGVLDGAKHGELPAQLGGRPIAGATVIIRAFDLPADEHCPLMQKAKSIRIAMGENDGKSFYRVRLVMKDSESADQIKTIGEGFKALASLHFSGDADMMKLVNGLKMTSTDGTINVRWEAPVQDVWTAAEKMAKKAEEH